jgi:hypothetical protein
MKTMEPLVNTLDENDNEIDGDLAKLDENHGKVIENQ